MYPQQEIQDTLIKERQTGPLRQAAQRFESLQDERPGGKISWLARIRRLFGMREEPRGR